MAKEKDEPTAGPAPSTARRVIIENKEGASYSVPEGNAADQPGFKILRYEDGEPYKAKE